MKLQRPLVELLEAAHQVAMAYQVLGVVQVSMQDPLLAVEVTALVVASVQVGVKRQPVSGLAVVVGFEQQLAAAA